MIDQVQQMQQQTQAMIADNNERMKNMQQYGFGLGFGQTKKGGYKYNPRTKKLEQTYLTPTGNRYSSKALADAESFRYRQEASKPLGINMNDQQVNAAQKPANAAIAALWKEAEAKYAADRNKNAEEVYSGNPWLHAGREMHIVDAATNSHKNEVSRLTRFDLQKMMDNAWGRVGKQMTASCYQQLKKQYPTASEQQLQNSASAMARQLSDNAVYKYAVAKNTPKSTLEFFAKTAADMNLLRTITKGLARSEAGTTGDLDAYERAMSNYGKNHRWAQVGGKVAGMFFDPTTYISGGIGSFGGKMALNVGGRIVAKKAATNVGARLFGNTLAGRVVAGSVGGGLNFGTYEGIKEGESQWLHGGHINSQTGENEGYSAGDILKSTGRGTILGSVTGTISPLLGNVADKWVKATSNTAGKIGIRFGELATSTVAEGTIFSTPEWIENSKLEDDNPNKRSAWDVWTDNMAMMLGFKGQHMVKSAPRVIAGLQPIKNPKTMQERNHNRMSFGELLRKQLDASPRDMAFTKEEREELQKYGYGDLAALFTRTPKQPKAKAKQPTTTDGKVMNFDIPEAEVEDLGKLWLKTHPEFDGYEAMQRLIQDPSVSQSARAKAYYILTGHQLPMGSVTGYTTEQDENGNIFVKSVTANGEVVTSRRFADETLAKKEQDKIMRQAELNSVDVGERYTEAKADNKVFEAAVEAVAPGADPETVKRNYQAAKEGDKYAIANYGQMVDAIDKFMEENRGMADAERPEAIRAAIKEETGVDVDAAIKKEPSKRTEPEQAAVEDYLKRLFPEQNQETEQPMSDDEAGAAAIYDQSRLLWDKVEQGDADAKADVDAIVLRMQEALRECEDAFGTDAEMRMAEMQDNPWALANDPELTEDQQNAVLYYINAKAAMDGVQDASNDAMENKRREVAANVERHTHKDNGMVQPATMKVDDKPVYIVKGNVVPLPDGTGIDVRNSDQSIVICDAETGEYKFTSPDQIFNMGEAIDPQTELDEAYANIQAEHEAVLGGMENGESVPKSGESVHETPENAQRAAEGVTPQPTTDATEKPTKPEVKYDYHVKMKDVGGNAVSGRVTNLTADGVEIEFDAPYNGKMVDRIPLADFDSGVSEIADANGNVLWNETEVVGDTEVAPQVDAAPTQAGQEDAEKPAIAQAEQDEAHKPTALERIPRNENGEPVFEQAENPEAAWDALVEFSDGNAATAKEIADAMTEEKRKALEKAQKLKLKGKTPAELLASKQANAAELAKAESEYNHWQRMANVEQNRQNAIRAQQEAEARQRATERAEAERAEREAREEAERREREALEGIPEWHMDTPENARKRGARRYGGQIFTRQEPVNGVVGKEVEVKFSQKDLPKGHVVVMEAEQLQPSHIQGKRNPMFFIEEAQPKNRAEDVSQTAARNIAENIRPQEITSSTTAYTGAPTINTRGEVIQGNNRSDALRYLWQNNLPEQQQAYKQYLLDQAEQLGLDSNAINAMQHPVLVNQLDVDDAEAIRLGQMTAQDTESGGVERIKPKNVAQKLGDNMRSFANRLLSSSDNDVTFGQLVDRNGEDVLNWMNQIGAISNTQYQSAFDSKGKLTPEAKNDLQKVLYQAVFNGGSQQLEEMFDRLPAKAQRAILSTAFRDMDSPFAGKMLPEIQSSIIAYNALMQDEGFASAKNMEEVLRAIETFKHQTALDDRFEQYMPADNFSNFALHLAGLYKASDISQTTIASYFNEMYDLAQGKKAATLFEEADTTEYPLAEVIKKVLGIDYKPAKNGNNNVANGGADVALRNQEGQGRQPRSNKPSASGEQNQTRTESPERGGGTENAGSAGGEKGNLPPTEGREESEENELDENGRPFIKAENGTTVFGEITDDSGLTAAPIKLSEGFQDANTGKGYGLVHIEANHGEQIRQAGFTSVKEFVSFVATHYDPDNIRVGKRRDDGSGTFLIQVTDTHDNTLFIELSKDGSYWNVNSGGIFRKGYSNKKETVAKTEPQQPTNAVSSDSSLSANVKDGITNAEPNGEPTVSLDKDTTLPADQQTSDEENTKKVADSEGKNTLKAKIEAASAEVNTDPTEAQKEAGNYKKGHVQVGAFDVTIENPKGSERSGTDANGKKWSVKMNNTYGYIRGTEGVDGDHIHIDVFLAEDMDKWDGKYVFVVDQYNPDGTFDEHKVMLGFNSTEEARSAYLSNYENGWENGRRIDVTAVNLDDFEKWIESSKRKTKPFAEYVVVKKETVGKSGNISDEEIENAAFALGLHGENQTLMRLELDNTPERARQILDRAKKWNEKNAASSTTLSKDETTYTITPSTYTNKKGKTSDVSLLTFDHNLTADQERAVKEFAKERIGEGRFAPVRGWKDRESGGWIFRSEEDARKAAEMVGNEEAVADNQPMTAQELRDAVEPKKPTASKKTAAKKPANRVEVADVAERKPSVPTKSEQPKQYGEKKLVITDEMKHDEDILRELLGIGDEELDGGIKFRDPDAMTSQQRRFVYNAGVNYSLGYIDQGFVKFPEFAKAMVSRLGYKIKPWLKSFYEGAKRIPGYDQAMFTPTEEVDAFDVENFDKPHKDVFAQANMIVEEGKAQVAAEKANNELKATRNEQRKETEKQTAANTDAIGSKATSVASEVENLAETSSDRQELGGASERVDETLDKVNEQLALLGYYEAEEVEKDYNEAYGYMRNAEKKAVKDAANLASQLIDDLGLDRFEATHGKADKKGKRKTKPLAVANIAPLGGDVSMHLPLEEGRELYVNIQLVPSAGRGVAKFEGDNLEVTRIMFRVDNPNGNGNGRYDRRYGINVWVNKDVTYSELLDKVKREVYKYLPKRTEVSDGKYAAGDKVQYSTDGGRTWTDAVVAHPNDEGGYLIDTGLAPVLWVNAHPDQLRHKPESNTISDTELIKRITEHPLFKELVDNNPDAQAARTLLGERIMTDVRLSLRKDGYVETYKKLLNDKGFSEKIADKAFAKRHIVSKNDEGGYFYEDGINEDAVAALPEGIHIKDDVTRRSENGGVQHTASEKPVGKPKSASQKTTKKVKPEQSVGDLFAGPLDNTSDNGLQGNDDAVRTETVPADNSGQQQGLQESQGSPRKRAEQEGGRPDGGRGGQSTKKDGAVSAGLHGLTEPKNTRNNHSERGADHAPTSVNGRIEANIKAIELAHDLLESGETATPEQMGVLRKFSGWGGLGAAFSDGGNDWKQRERNKKIRELLGEEAYEQAVMSANSAYYTPAYVVDTLWDIANQLGFKGGNILEGSAGIGNILGQMPTAVSEHSDIHAIEIDGTSGGILSLLYPDAKVDIQGFEQTRIPNGSVDLAITNVPFVTGLRVNDTTGDSDLSKKFHNIHDFCIAKNVRKLREGGLGIFISSNGTLDNSKALRDWVVNEGGSDFIGAFRMNNKTFGGTTVTSDIIVIRKRMNGQKSAQAIDVSNISGERTAEYEEPGARKAKQLSMDYNKYFIEHPDHMAGEMRFAFEEGDTFRPTSKGLYPVSGKDQGKMLADFVKSFMEEERGSAETTESDKPVYVNDASVDGKKLGEMYLKDGKLVTAGMGGYYPLEVNDKKIKGHTKQECFNAYIAIKSALADVMKYQTENEGDAGLQPLIEKLNKAYDAFVSTYGHFTKNNQLAWLRNDVDYPNVFSLEVYKEQGDGKGGVVKTYDKADVMKGRVVEKESEPHPENVKDGVVVSMFKNGRIDVPYIAGQLGMGEDAVKREIIESGLGFEDPTSRQMEVSYQYLSGNVREKLKQAEANNENGEYDKNIKALQEVVPMNIPAHLIDFTLGSSWLDPKLYDAYVKERTDIDVHFTAAGGTWFMNAPTYGVNVEKNRAMGVVSEMLKKTIMGHELIGAAIQNKSVIVSRTEKHYDGTTETITDREATSACAAKIDEIRQDFKDWMRQKMQSDADLSACMETEYNDRFNNYVPMSIPDDFVPEYFGGATHKFKMRPHQGKAIVRGTMQPLLLAHEVGTGKTFTLISTAMEMRRLGTARKPMIVVQNATVGQFAASAKELYPNAKILTLEDNDRNAEGRKNFYAKIKYNDWDMIVVPQSTFEFIPDSDERQMQFVQDKIDEKMLVLEKMREADTSGRDPITRRAEKELADLQAEMAALSEDISKKRTANNEKKKAVAKQNAAVKAQEMLDRRTDDVENFDDMGIDALLIDEAHEYKHLGFATAMQRGVKGVDPSYSKKSQGVYLKTQAILEKNNGRNVIFATGTPISNTAAEIWTFMRYLMPKDTMKEYGIYYFDDFVRNFGNIQQMPEFNTSGKFKEVNRFAGYVNLPELVRIWSGVADTVLTKDQTELVKKIPEMEGGKAQDIYLPQTRALRSVMKYVREELERFDQMSGKEKKENSSIPLTMYGIAQGAAVDARLVEMHAEDDPRSKTNEAVRQTLRSLKETDDYKGTVAIFADHYQNKRSGFNLYEDIKKKLIKQGVPENEIVVMKSGMKIKQKLEIFEKVNRGEVRVILGSTATLGTGVNIQERLHTLIHLDAPNRPMDYTQRNGRILRQGNLHKQWGKPVRVLRFGVEDSLDVTAYQRLKTKGAIADSVMEGDRLMQDSMNNRVLEEEEDVFGDTVAQLSGSEYALLKNNAEKNVRKYESRRKQWEADQTYIHNAKPKLEGQIKAAEQRAEEANAHLLAVQKAFPNGKFTEITVGKQKFGSIEAMADFIKEHNKKVHDAVKEMKKNPGNAKQTSTFTLSLGGYDFVVKTELSRETVNSGGSLFAEIHRKMSYSCPELGLTDMPVKQSLLRNAVEDITENVITGKDFAERFDFATRAVAHGKSELEQLKQREGKPFEFSKELEEAKRQFEEYSEAMKVEMEEKEKKYAEMDASVDAATDVVADDEDEADDGNSKHRMLEDDTPNVIENDSNAMVDRVTELSERLHTPVRIIRTEEEVADLPSARQRRMKGSFNPITGEVTIVVPNNANMTDIENTFVHEVVGHDGLRVLFPDEAKLNNALDELYRVSKDEIRGTIDRMAQKMYDAEVDRLRERKRKEYEAKGEDTNTLYHTDIEKARSEASKKSEQFRRDATEEYAADLAGRIGESGFETMSAEELTFWGKLTTILQKALQKLLDGLKIQGKRKWSDKDWAFVLHEAYKRKKNGGKPTVFDAADTVVMRRKTGFGETKFSYGHKKSAQLNEAALKHLEPTDVEHAAKVQQKREKAKEALANVAKTYKNTTDSKGFISDLSNSLGLTRGSTGSGYGSFETPNGKVFTIRVSNHNINAANVGDEPVESIVIKTKRSPNRFHAEDGKFANEYVYFKEDIRKAPAGTLSAIAESISDLLDTGEYHDKTGLAKDNHSPETDPDGGMKFRDGDMGLDETITQMKIAASQANADNWQAKQEAMKAIGGNLNKLRQAMARQREYDLSTVKSITDLAKVLLDNGLLDDLSKYETKRILSTVNNAHGKQDTSNQVAKVMDIMVDNQLRMGANMLGRLLSTRGSRVDARGIEVQGQLDPDGQTIAQVVRKATSLPKSDIEERIAEALNRMGSDDQAVADEAALEYSGLLLAHQFAEDITDSKAEEKALRDSIKQAKEDLDAGMMEKDAYHEYVEATNDSIRQNKIERAEAYRSIVEQVGSVLGGSVERAKQWREAEKQRVEAIHHNANSDMVGRPTDEHHKEGKVQKIANNSAVRFLLAPLGTFDQMLRMFGKKSVNGEGYLWNRYMRGWVDATEREYKGYQNALKTLDEKVSEVFGKNMKWGDLFAMERKMPKATITFWDGGERKDHELTQGNLLYIYMVDKMADGRMKLRRMGITEEDVENIKDFVDPRFLQLADWMQEEFLVGKRNEYNDVHKRMFGASMAAIENYFPLKILANARIEDVDVADDTTDTALPATSTGSIIKRRRNNLALDVMGADAFSVILDHIQQMERWAAFAEFNRDLNTLLSYKHFRNQVMNMSSVYGGGKTLWNNFRNVCSMAAGAYRPPIAQLDKAAVNIAKGVTAAKVSFRVFTTLKQFLSMPAYLSDSNPVYLAANIANPIGAWKWSMENLPLFEKRWKSRMAGDPRLMKSEMDWKMWRSHVVEIASRIGMSPNAFVDALTVAIGSHAMYQTKKQKYLRYGYDEEVAEKRAKQDATILFNQTQQSSESAFLSTMQVDRSWLSVLFTIFRNSSMSYTRQLYDAIRNIKHRFEPGYQSMSEEYMAKQMRRDGIDPDKADSNAKSEYRRSLLRDIARIGVFGYILQFAWNLGAYLPYLIAGDDKDEKSKMWDDVINHTMFGSIEGLTGGDVMSSAGQMALNGDANWSYLVKDMPLASDLATILQKMPKDKVAAMNDVVNLLVQSGVGVNPQSLTDAVVAIMDYCGDDAETSRECALLIARIINCPQSQTDKIYFDELAATAAEASKMTPAEIAERYAEYKIHRGAPLTGWAYSEEARDSVKTAQQNRVLTKAKEKMSNRMETEATKQLLSTYDEVSKQQTELSKLKKTDRAAYREGMKQLRQKYNMREHGRMKRYKHDMKQLTEKYLRSKNAEERNSLVRVMTTTRDKLLDDIGRMNQQ